MDPFTIIGGIGAGLSGLSSLASGITGLLGMGRQSQQSKMDQTRWERMREPTGQVFKQLYFAPPATGKLTPYGTWTQEETYGWSPSESMQKFYDSFLQRQYGMPTSVARTMAAQAMQPTQIPRIPGLSAAQTPGQVGSAVSAGGSWSQPQTLAEAMINRKLPDVQANFDYLKSAADLAAFNLYRAQFLPQLIG